MDPQNPYAPPVETSDAPPMAPPDTGGLSLSEQGWATVTSLAKWMRIVSTFFFILGALAALGTVVMLIGGGAAMSRGSIGGASGGAVAIGMFVMLATTVLLFLGGAWLRQSAFHFYDGVLSNAEHALAQGFRKLRLYMILYGIYGILQLIKTVVELVTTSGM